jgi:hypothetical protein
MPKLDKAPSVSDLDLVTRFVDATADQDMSLAAFGREVGLSRGTVADAFERVDQWTQCRMCEPLGIGPGIRYQRTGRPTRSAKAIAGAVEILQVLVKYTALGSGEDPDRRFSPQWVLELNDDILDLIDERVDIAKGRKFATLKPRRRKNRDPNELG